VLTVIDPPLAIARVPVICPLEFTVVPLFVAPVAIPPSFVPAVESKESRSDRPTFVFDRV
jgi:hypothetical protein